MYIYVRVYVYIYIHKPLYCTALCHARSTCHDIMSTIIIAAC